jgi:hypothetical protein
VEEREMRKFPVLVLVAVLALLLLCLPFMAVTAASAPVGNAPLVQALGAEDPAALFDGFEGITPEAMRSPMVLALIVALAFQLLFRPFIEYTRALVGLLVTGSKPPEAWTEQGFVYSIAIYAIGFAFGLWLESSGVTLSVPCWLNALFVLALTHGEYEGIKNLLALVGVDVRKISLQGWKWV